MQTMEAIFSLLFFVAITSSMFLSAAEERGVDDSLYRIQLAGDAWRILYLRDDFKDFGELSRARIESDMRRVGELTGLCFFINGTRFTNCRGGDEKHIMTATLRRTVICNGTPESITFSMGR